MCDLAVGSPFGEQGEDVVLALGQAVLVPAAVTVAADGGVLVVEQVLDHSRAEDVSAPGHRDVDRLRQIFGRGVLQEVSRRAVGEGPLHVRGVLVGGDHDHGHIGPLGSDRTEELQTVEVGHPHVDQRQVEGRSGVQDLQGDGRGFRLDDIRIREALLHHVVQATAHQRVVVDDQDPHVIHLLSGRGARPRPWCRVPGSIRRRATRRASRRGPA